MEDKDLKFLTTKQVAMHFDVTTQAVRDWIKHKKIRAVNVGIGAHKAAWRIPYSEIQRIHAEAYEEED